MAISRDVVQARLLELERRVARLKALSAGGEGDAWRDQVERNLQIGIQSLIDIGTHAISDKGWEMPATLDGLFAVLARRGVMGADLAERLGKMARLRNLLVHNYLAVDPKRLTTELPQGIVDLRDGGIALRTLVPD